MRTRYLVVFALAVLALTACGSSSKKSDSSGSGSTVASATKARPHVTIEANEYAFVLPSTMPSGWVDVTIHTKETAKEGHQIAFVKLGSMSYDAFKTAVGNSDLKAIPADTVFVGGPNNAEPGQSVTSTIHLEPGTYGVACFIPASDGKSHAAHGMVGQITVAATAETVDTEPAADAGTLSLGDFSFDTGASFNGKGTIAIKNDGVQVHEAIIVKLAPGKTVKDALGFFASPAGPPPFESAGGIVGLGPKQTMYEQLALTPGNYGLLCFFPDPTKNNTPHALEGMTKEFTIS